MGEKPLRGFIWEPYSGADACIGVVARTHDEAKRLGYNWWVSEYGREPERWIEQRCKLAKSVDILGIDAPCVISDSRDGLRRGFYSGVDYEECDICRMESYVTLVNGKYICSDCEEKEEAIPND